VTWSHGRQYGVTLEQLALWWSERPAKLAGQDLKVKLFSFLQLNNGRCQGKKNKKKKNQSKHMRKIITLFTLISPEAELHFAGGHCSRKPCRHYRVGAKCGV
jgi:hypothetical protein